MNGALPGICDAGNGLVTIFFIDATDLRLETGISAVNSQVGEESGALLELLETRIIWSAMQQQARKFSERHERQSAL